MPTAETTETFCGYPKLDMKLKDALRHLSNGRLRRVFYDEPSGLGMVIKDSVLNPGSLVSEQFKTSGRFLAYADQVVALPDQLHTVD